MIGHTLEARNPYWGGILWLIVAAAFLAITLVTKQLGWAVFGILPAAVGVAFLFSNPPDFYAEVTPSELIVHSHQQTIPYREIRRVWYPGSNARAVYVQHSRGVLRIPRTFKASAAQIHAFLCSVQPPAPPPDVHPTIRHYYQTQLHTFGMDRVWAHNARLEYLEYENRRSKLVGWA